RLLAGTGTGAGDPAGRLAAGARRLRRRAAGTDGVWRAAGAGATQGAGAAGDPSRPGRGRTLRLAGGPGRAGRTGGAAVVAGRVGGGRHRDAGRVCRRLPGAGTAGLGAGPAGAGPAHPLAWPVAVRARQPWPPPGHQHRPGGLAGAGPGRAVAADLRAHRPARPLAAATGRGSAQPLRNQRAGRPGRTRARTPRRAVARRRATREFNLSTDGPLRDDNRVVAGEYWGERVPATPEISVEAGYAESLDWELGDRISFDIAGQRLEATLTSLREVDWESFRP